MIVFSRRVSEETRSEVIETLNIKEVSSHWMYLGLPLIIGKSKREVFQSVRDRVWTLMNGWRKEKLFSMVGRWYLSNKLH